MKKVLIGIFAFTALVLAPGSAQAGGDCCMVKSQGGATNSCTVARPSSHSKGTPKTNFTSANKHV